VTLDLACAYELHPKVALRPERFGALAYSYETRRLSLLKDPLLADVVRGLAGAPTAGAALDAVPAARRAAVTKALDRLVETGFVVPRAAEGSSQRPVEASTERTS
jgi:putative mycofactocin binding protein MftB